jgi:short subunit dehydrogenase-like uncharacterized protein
MHANSFLLYGANGYTGQLITALAADYRLQPVLAGRTKEAIHSLAKQHNLPYRIIDLDNEQQLITALKEHPVVLHAAGPFRHTAEPMIEACIKTNTHYLDITGEIEVFELAKHYDAVAKQAGIMIMPGTGFDVVPTDCLSLFLKNALPDADYLKLAFSSIGGSISHGTATTMAEGLGEGGAVREGGKIIRKPLGHKGMWVDFGEQRLFVMSIPWGDIATAYHTTGIPNIETYTGISPRIYKLLKAQALFNWLLRSNALRNFIKGRINKRPDGPTPEKRKASKSLVWGEVVNSKGQTAQARLTCLDGYTLTAHSSLIITKKVLNGDFKTGYQTPASAFGAELILEVPGAKREHVQIID